jgi:hypothetical protein
MNKKEGWIGDPEVKDIRITKDDSATRLTKMQTSLPGLIGYGITTGSDERISVLVEKSTPEIEAMFRKGIRGQKVKIIEIGHVVALNIDRTTEYRPLFGGISVGHYKITAGTLGSLVYDISTGVPMILSNCHVLANSDTPDEEYAIKGDPIYQPGLYDYGDASLIGRLEKWVPLEDGITVDAATATTSVGILNAIEDIPKITGVASPKVGMYVKKSGRTTGFTEGKILSVESIIDVDYGYGTVRLQDQFITTNMSEGGDSGSVGITEDGKVVGLLFAGSTSVTVFNDINNVIEELGIKFVPYGVDDTEDDEEIIPSPPGLSQTDLILIALGAITIAITYSCIAR